MNSLIRKSLAASLAAATALTAGCAHTANGQASLEGEARLSAMIDGRVAGEPQSCIPAFSDNDLEVIDETALVYDAGDTIYVARPQDPDSLDTRDVLVIDRFSGQLCAQDVIRTVDRASHFTTGVVFLEDWVPYRRS